MYVECICISVCVYVETLRKVLIHCFDDEAIHQCNITGTTFTYFLVDALSLY